MLIEFDEAEAVLALGFLKLLRDHLPAIQGHQPDVTDVRAKALEVARWLGASPIATDDEAQHVRAFLNP